LPLTKKNAIFGAHICMVLKHGHFRKWFKNTWKILTCAGERCSSFGPIVWEMKKYCVESRRKETSKIP